MTKSKGYTLLGVGIFIIVICFIFMKACSGDKKRSGPNSDDISNEKRVRSENIVALNLLKNDEILRRTGALIVVRCDTQVTLIKNKENTAVHTNGQEFHWAIGSDAVNVKMFFISTKNHTVQWNRDIKHFDSDTIKSISFVF